MKKKLVIFLLFSFLLCIGNPSTDDKQPTEKKLFINQLQLNVRHILVDYLTISDMLAFALTSRTTIKQFLFLLQKIEQRKEVIKQLFYKPNGNAYSNDFFKIKDNSRYYSILSIPDQDQDQDANNDKLFLFKNNKLSLTSLLDTLKKIKEKLLPSSNQTTSNNLTEVTKIISDLFSIDSKKNSDDLIGIFEEYRKETNKKINSITGGIGNEEYSKFLNIACKNKFFEIKDLDNAFQSSQLAGGNNINDNLSNSYSKYCGLEFLFIQCLLLLKLLKLETSLEKKKTSKKNRKRTSNTL
jgi:hypothetical protein